ncbi:MAG TPA: peptidoglycan-binding domain-containing protein [Bryobacteraceae bacterium]|jgi:peptidoglycan hydrolase-like protein with peptidoglycan-binding domain
MALSPSDIKALQNLLNDYFDKQIPVTGVYDAATRGQVLAYQSDQQLAQDGDAGAITMALLRGQSMQVQAIPDPPVLLEPDNEWICWSDALVSFLQVTHDVNVFSPDDWVSNMDSKGFTGENDGLTPQGWDSIRKSLNLQSILYSNARNAAHSRTLFGADTLFNAIQKFGYIILVYNIGNDGYLAHTVLIYGMQLNSGDTPHYVLMMDPWRAGKVSREFTFFIDRPTIGLMSKKPGQYAMRISNSMPFMIPTYP